MHEKGCGMHEKDWRSFDLYAPTPEHLLLADTLREHLAG